MDRPKALSQLSTGSSSGRRWFFQWVSRDPDILHPHCAICPPGRFGPVRPCGPHGKRKHSRANKSQPPQEGEVMYSRGFFPEASQLRVRTGQLCQWTAGRCTAHPGGQRTLSSQGGKLQLAGGRRLALPTLLTFANKLLAVLHFPLRESVLIHLGASLAPSHLVLLRDP